MKRIFLLVVGSIVASGAGASFKCVDDKGVTRIGDAPPPECANVVVYEMSRSGTVLRKIDPSLTAEQIRARAEEAEKNKAAMRAEGDKKRADMALLNTYSSEKEFDVARDRNIEPIKGRIASAVDRIQQVEARQKRIEEEMEFFKTGKSKTGKGDKAPAQPPAAMVEELKRSQAEKAALVSATAGYEKEIEQVKAKYEADKKRWVELKAEQQGAKATEAKADPKADSKAKPADTKPADAKAAPKKS